MTVSEWDLIIRLLLATFLGGIIGYERELKGRDAGIRTHTLVSLGAAIITLTQLEASEWVLNFAMENPDFADILSSDITRLTAQIVNGIGFLGAGTIIVSRRTVTGLTTAASIWAVASLGIAVGMGYYLMAVTSTVIMLVVLRVVKNVFKIERTKQLEIRYRNRDKTLRFLEERFKEYEMNVLSADHSITYEEDGTSECQDVYTVHLPPKFNMMQFVAVVGDNPDIFHITTIKTEFDN